MNFLIIVLALAALPACCGSLDKAADQSSEAISVSSFSAPTGAVIVVFKKGVSLESARAVVKAHSMTITRTHESLHKHSDHVFSHLISDTLTSEEMVRLLEKDPRVHSAREDFDRSLMPDLHRQGTD